MGQGGLAAEKLRRVAKGAAVEKLKRAAHGVSERGGAARSGTELTTPQRDLVERLLQLHDAGDWVGIVALRRETMAVAKELCGTAPRLAGRMHSVLGEGLECTGNYALARELYEQDIARCKEMGDLAGVAMAFGNLGLCYHRTGDYAQALLVHQESRKICEELGDSKLVARACGNLGNCYFSMGKYARALELYELHRKMAEVQGDQEGVGTACGNLGNCYYRMGKYGQACGLHEKHRALAEAVGDRAGVARACTNIGSCYLNTGEYERAKKMLKKSMATAEELGDRVGVAMALGNFGLCYQETGDYVLAREANESSKRISEEIGDRPGVAKTCGNIAKCYLNTGDYRQAISYFRQNYDMAKEMEVELDQAEAALGMGVALRLEVRASVRGPASVLQGPPVSVSACIDDAVREAEKWLQIALDFGYAPARLHLAHIAFDAGTEGRALQYLHDYLSWCVEHARNQCDGCCQTRDEDAQMLTCGGCRVARFCSVDHQKMASKSVAEGGSLLQGRHRDVCALLRKWRQQVVKRDASPAVLRTDLLAFLRM
tara:strand:- start:358 stop:1995 length:1638 start_codon:yes stop_codon:yes gene_type:complete